jgi:hypothetical protein
MAWLLGFPWRTPPRRPPGRCPNCHRMTLQPELPSPGRPGPQVRIISRCVCCGSRFQRPFAGLWSEIRRDEGIAWIEASGGPPARPTPSGPESRTRPFPASNVRFKIRQVMIVIAWVSLILAVVKMCPTPWDRLMAMGALVMFHGCGYWFLRLVRRLSRPPLPGDPPSSSRSARALPFL